MLVLLLALACASSPPPAGGDGNTATGDGGSSLTGDAGAADGGSTDGGGPDGGSTDGGSTDGGSTDGGGTNGGGTDGGSDTGAPGVSYVGPDYQACVTDAQCEPGSGCLTVPGHMESYCAPPCDPTGDGAECDLTGTGDMGFPTTCLRTGRCAQACAEDAVAAPGSDGISLVRDPDDACPDGLECTQVEATDGTAPLCAGPQAGGSGYYGICSHPNVDGGDCPEQTSCFGGSYIGLDIGICLPWCDDGSCPASPAGVSAAPLCYDAGLEHPVCALICIFDSSSCPDGQFCQSVGSVGLCIPDGAELPI